MIRLDLPGPIAVWQVDLALPPARPLLAPEEQARAARFRFDRDRNHYVACRTALRLLLADALGMSPESIPFTYGPKGKPESALPFNVSHSGGLALIALGGSAPLGVDIEQVRTDLEPLSLGRTVYTEAELAALAALPKTAQHDAFFEAWTRKEAIIKAEGGGFSSPLLARSVWPEPEPWITGRYQLTPLPAPTGYRAALAVTKKEPGIAAWP